MSKDCGMKVVIVENAMVGATQKVCVFSAEERREMGRQNRNRCMERNTEEAFLKAYINLIET